MKVSKILVTGENFTALLDQLRMHYGRNYNFNSGNLYVYINEDSYFRIGSNLTNTVIVNLNDEINCTIEFICSGGGTGMDGTTWGSEGKSFKEFIEFLKNLCQRNSWTYKVIS